MVSVKKISIAVVFGILLVVGFATVGCGKKPESAWVNTQSMPGKTFSKYAKKETPRKSSNQVIYLGSSEDSTSSSFGPRDVSFDFKDLR